MSAVVTPGTAICRTLSSALATTRPASRISEISRGLLSLITRLAGLPPGPSAPRRPIPEKIEVSDGRGNRPRWEEETTSLELLAVLITRVMVVGHWHESKSLPVEGECSIHSRISERPIAGGSGRLPRFFPSLPVHQARIIPHHEMAVNLLNEVEANADHDQEPRAAQK